MTELASLIVLCLFILMLVALVTATIRDWKRKNPVINVNIYSSTPVDDREARKIGDAIKAGIETIAKK